jgi:hypothetical protein
MANVPLTKTMFIKIREKIFPLLLLILSAACIDPLDVLVSIPPNQLVVDGLITDKPGPYQVKLFYSNTLNGSTLSPYQLVTKATVSVTDNLGNKSLFYEITPGIYRTKINEITGVVGRSYFLTIKTENGKTYQSSNQLLTKGGEITNIDFEFEANGWPSGKKGKYVDALKVFIDAQGDPGKENLFRWHWTTVYTAKSNPELRTRGTAGGDVPFPEPCSGFVLQFGVLVKVGECTCCICWPYSYSQTAIVSKNNLVSNNTFNHQGIGKIPATPMHFYEKYFIEIEQLSLSPEAYDFWRLVEKQQSGATDLFQPNAIKIKGNIECISDPNEKPLGFFGVSGVVTKGLYIDKSEIPHPLARRDTVPFACEKFFFNSVTVRPAFF